MAPLSRHVPYARQARLATLATIVSHAGGKALSGVRVAAVLALVIVISACTPATVPSVPQQEVAQRGGQIVEGSFVDAKTLQPVLSTDATSASITAKIYDSLIEVDAKTGEVRPNLGRWSTSPDGLTYSWEIDATARWSDGTQITGEDWLTGVKATARSKKTVRRGNFQDIEGFDDYRDGKATAISGIKVDGKRFTVKLTKAFCPALSRAFGGYVLPTHIFGKYTIDGDPTKNLDEAPENVAPPVASGPFIFKEWRRGDQIVLTRNELYWHGAPLLDSYVLKVVADATVVAAQLRTGELTLATIEPKDLEEIERRPELKVAKYPQLSIVFIGWNTKSVAAPGLQDKRVRQALAHGLDIDAVTRAVLFGHATKMVSYHPPVSWAFTSGLSEYKYDRAKAEELIRQAGWTKAADGFYAKETATLGFTITTNSGDKTRESLVQVAQEQYRQIGVRVTPRIESRESLVEKVTTGSSALEAYVLGAGLATDPDPYNFWHSNAAPDPAKKRTGFNATGFTSPELDKAIDEGRNGPDCSLAARKRAYERFNRILNDEQPYNFGFTPNTLLVMPAALRGAEPGPYEQTPRVHTWWLKR